MPSPNNSIPPLVSRGGETAPIPSATIRFPYSGLTSCWDVSVAISADRCPVGSERVDENAARVNGAITVAILALSLWPPVRWLQFYLLVDFGIKVFAGFAYSPSCFVARRVADALELPNEPIPAAPKRFAGAVALFFVTGSLVSWYAAGSVAAFLAFTAVFLVCAFLETFAGFCLGCYVYGLLPAKIGKAFVR